MAAPLLQGSLDAAAQNPKVLRVLKVLKVLKECAA